MYVMQYVNDMVSDSMFLFILPGSPQGRSGQLAICSGGIAISFGSKYDGRDSIPVRVDCRVRVEYILGTVVPHCKVFGCVLFWEGTSFISTIAESGMTYLLWNTNR